MNKSESNRKKYIPFLKTFSQVDIAMIKSLLEGNIDFYFKDENFLLVRPLLEPAVLMIREDYIDEAKEILKNFELNYLGISLKNDLDDEQ